VAAYLRGGIEDKSATEKILERLALPETARPAAAPRPALQAEPKADDKKLEALTKVAKPASPPARLAPVAEREQPVDLSKADEKLSSLLGKPK
jgi:hypothetical protein